jgi:D-3-phosphoglycerate dehydrogenase
MPLEIVATEVVPRSAEAAFADLGKISVDDGRDGGLLQRADVLIVRTTPVDRAFLDRTSHLRVIARTGVGLDSIDLDEATRRKLPVLYAPDTAALPIAEGTLALIFAVSKRLREFGSVLDEGRWEDRYRCDVLDLAGSTLGIVGLGRIGSEVARLALAIGMDVIAYDPHKPTLGVNGQSGSVGRATLEQLFRDSDVVTLHCGLNETSRGMITRELLAGARPGAILINASRGGLIADDRILTEALDKGWLSGVGLDVFATEPPEPHSKLLHDPRVISTPHAIGLTRAWNERVFSSLAGDVRRVLNGVRPRFIANPEIL